MKRKFDMFKTTVDLKHGFDGVKSVELHLLTAGGALDALELGLAENEGEVSMLRLRMYELANMVTVGGAPVTVEQIKNMLSTDYDTLNQAAKDLEKKLEAPAETHQSAG